MYLFVIHYIPPINSNVIKEFDHFEQLELDFIKYTCLGKVLITGDINSITSTLIDYLEFDKY
jgi:hypothetical protein